MSANDELQAHTCEKMSEFYGDVANNVAQSNSQDLTEQLKNGKLPAGCYYVLLTTDEVISDLYNPYGYFETCEGLVKKVLEPSPNYGEWRYLNKENKQLRKWCEEFDALNVAKENKQLKELLQKCKVAFKIYANEDETCGLEEENKYAKHLLTKIDEVLK